MAACSELQDVELAKEKTGYGAGKHQHFVGTAFLDAITEICGSTSTLALKGSTEEAQFKWVNSAEAGRISLSLLVGPAISFPS